MKTAGRAYSAKTRFEDVQPTRWRRTRAFAGGVTRVVLADGPEHGITQTGFQAVYQEIMAGYNPGIAKLPREKRPDNPVDVMNAEMTVGLYGGSFWAGNRNVVAMDPAVLDLLRHTDADDVPMQAVRWTHPFVYIALPAGTGLSLPGKPNEVDGAYVDMRIPNHIQIAITSRRTDVDTRRQTWPLSIEPHYSYSAELVPGETVGEFVIRCVTKRTAELRNTETAAAMEEAVRLANEDPEIGRGAGREFSSASRANNERRAQVVEDGSAAAAKTLGLVVNLMCYLSTEPETARDYSPRPPRALAEKAASGTDRQKRVAREEMARLGILPILVAGRGSAPDTGSEDTGTSGHELPSHWRRGHYNTYWTGPGRTVPKINWIRPQIINAHKGAPQGIHLHPVVPPHGVA